MAGNESYEPEAVKDTKEFQVAKPCPIRQEVQYLFFEIPDQRTFQNCLFLGRWSKGTKTLGTSLLIWSCFYRSLISVTAAQL